MRLTFEQHLLNMSSIVAMKMIIFHIMSFIEKENDYRLAMKTQFLPISLYFDACFLGIFFDDGGLHSLEAIIILSYNLDDSVSCQKGNKYLLLLKCISQPQLATSSRNENDMFAKAVFISTGNGTLAQWIVKKKCYLLHLGIFYTPKWDDFARFAMPPARLY